MSFDPSHLLSQLSTSCLVQNVEVVVAGAEQMQVQEIEQVDEEAVDGVKEEFAQEVQDRERSGIVDAGRGEPEPVDPKRSGIPDLVRIRIKVPKWSGIGPDFGLQVRTN